MQETTHFGYTKVSHTEKTAKVGAVFSRVAPKYDLMNDLMSAGLHRLWKKTAVARCNIRANLSILDIAAGTADVSLLLSKKLNNTGHLCVADINYDMLSIGRAKLIDHNKLGNVSYLQANAEVIPVADNSFDRVCIAFGLRNVTNKLAAIEEMYRVLKPGGKLVILEFSHPELSFMQAAYDYYSFTVLPKLGELVLQDRESYQYLAESIRMHPNQTELLQMLQSCQFENCAYENLSAGICCIHTGNKI